MFICRNAAAYGDEVSVGTAGADFLWFLRWGEGAAAPLAGVAFFLSCDSLFGGPLFVAFFLSCDSLFGGPLFLMMVFLNAAPRL